MALTSRAVLLAAALGLAACSSGGNVVGPLLSTLRPGKSDAPPTASIPRAEIEKAGVAVMRVIVPSRGIDLLMAVRDTRGDVVTWQSGDGSTYAFRNGVLIATRGLGADLMSAAAPSAGQIAGGAGHSRSYFFVGPDEETLRRDYACQPQDQGRQSVVIYGLGYDTRQIAETCERPEGRITNTFWLQGATVRKSRQWVSAAVGYAEFELITGR